jgi:hypothetical protein
MTVTDEDREWARKATDRVAWEDVIEGVASTLAAVRDMARLEALTEARWAVHNRRFDHDHGETGGPDNFYNGVIKAERVIVRLIEEAS